MIEHSWGKSSSMTQQIVKHLQQRRKMFLSRGAGLENVRNVCAKRISAGFSPHLLGGSGGMLPRKIFEFRRSKISSGAF